MNKKCLRQKNPNKMLGDLRRYFFILNYLMENRKEMTIPVSNDIIFYKEHEQFSVF